MLSQSPEVARDERLNSLAGVVHNKSERLNNDLQNLLDAARVSRQQITPRAEWIEPQDIVNSAVERRRRYLAGRIRSCSIWRRTCRSSTSMPFWSSRPSCRSWTMPQNIPLPACPFIPFSAKRNASHAVVLSVRDVGAGLTAEEGTQIYERFFRGKAPRRRELQAPDWGYGSRRPLSAPMAERSRPRAQVRIGQGTMVAIHLPFATPTNPSRR